MNPFEAVKREVFFGSSCRFLTRSGSRFGGGGTGVGVLGGGPCFGGSGFRPPLSDPEQ